MVYDTVHEPTRTRGIVANKSDNGKGWFPYSANKLNGFDCGPFTCGFVYQSTFAIMDTHGELGIWPG